MLIPTIAGTILLIFFRSTSVVSKQTSTFGTADTSYRHIGESVDLKEQQATVPSLVKLLKPATSIQSVETKRELPGAARNMEASGSNRSASHAPMALNNFSGQEAVVAGSAEALLPEPSSTPTPALPRLTPSSAVPSVPKEQGISSPVIAGISKLPQSASTPTIATVPEELPSGESEYDLNTFTVPSKSPGIAVLGNAPVNPLNGVPTRRPAPTLPSLGADTYSVFPSPQSVLRGESSMPNCNKPSLVLLASATPTYLSQKVCYDAFF
jgi:hypothetical protein